MERRVEAAGEGLPMWQKRDISAVSGSEDRDLSERRTDLVRWGDELNVEAVSGSQGNPGHRRFPGELVGKRQILRT